MHFAGYKSVFSAWTFLTWKVHFWGIYVLLWPCKVHFRGYKPMFSAVTFLIANCTSFGYKSVFPDATFVAAKCTFWDQVCVFRCNLFRCKVYILGSSLCFQLQPLLLQSVHFGIKFVFWESTFVATKGTIWGQVCVLRATFVATQCTFWDQVCVLRCDLCRCKVYILQVRGRRQATWAPRVRPVTCAQTPTPTATPPTPTTRCAGAIRAGWPREPCVVSFQTYVILILSLPKNMCCWWKFIEVENESETRQNDW